MRYESVGARLYYTLGSAYYLFHWLLIIAGAGAGSAVLLLGSAPVVAAVLSVLSLGFLVAGLASWVAKTKKRLDCLNPDLVIVKMVDTYLSTEAKHFEYHKDITVRARRTGVDSYRMKFRWTGQGDIKIDLTNSQCTLQRQVGEHDTWDGVRVFFRSPLAKNQECSFGVRLTMTDDAGTAVPMLQKLIDDWYPHGLTMQVVLPQAPKILRQEIFRGPRSMVAIASDEKSLSENDKKLEWPIKRPLVGRRYKMSWS